MATKKSTKASPKKLQKLNDALEVLAQIDPEFPLQWAIVFLVIAENEESNQYIISATKEGYKKTVIRVDAQRGFNVTKEIFVELEN